jgi:hypothetical protein
VTTAAAPPQVLGRPAWRQPATLGAVTLAGTAYTAVANPDGHGGFPLCPLKFLTGIDCPFCGGLRATHALAHGHLVEAASHNLLFILAVPFLVAGWVLWMGRSLGRPWPTWRWPGWAPWVLGAALLAFTVLRNLPSGPFHWLGSA